MNQPLRHIITRNINNFRDIGGYPAKNLKMVQWGRIYRCSGLFRAKEYDWELIRKLKIATVIDLRSEKELLKKPINCPEDIIYIKQNMIDNYNTSSHLKSIEDGLPMFQSYINMCIENPKSIAKTIKVVVEALKRGNVLYFCYGGKDRTGILTSLLLFLLGVGIEDIISDYQISYTHRAFQYSDGLYKRRLDAFDRAAESKNNHSDPETMLNMIDMIETKDYIGMLLNNGLSNQTINELKQLLLIDLNI